MADGPFSGENGRLLARMDERLGALFDVVRELKAEVVTKDEFKPVKSVVYGLVAVILVSVITAVVAVVVR